MKKHTASQFARITNAIISIILTAVLVTTTRCSSTTQTLHLASRHSEGSRPLNRTIILATTTSTQDSGLLDVLLPAFEQETGYFVKPVAVGTGYALALGQRGEADVLLVHAPSKEKELMEDGSAITRQLIMHNDFIIVGPESDPAQISGKKSVTEAFKRIADSSSLFVSRGDQSGTHAKELEIWKRANIAPSGQKWYIESGSGMGQTLQIASEKAAYTLTDRATFLAQKKSLKLRVLFEGDPLLMNIYHAMVINPEKFDKVNVDGAMAFVNFLLSKQGQSLIGEFGVREFGEPLFFPDGGKTEEQLLKSQQ